MNRIYSILLLTLAFTAAQAQLDTVNPKSLGEVVVTGQYKPQSVKNSVYQVRVITRERIEKQGATKLQDVLNSELNMRFNQDVATGGSDITMMGLKGQNVKILLDGMPLIGRQGTSNEININQIDIQSIERIEIVEGPMSVIYGADALAGVINIITKKSAAAQWSVTARVQEETIGKEYGLKQGLHTQAVGLSWRHKQWEAGGTFSHSFFGGWKDTATGRELAWHKKDQLMASGFVGYHTSKFNIRYRIDGLDEVITNPGNFLFPQRSSGDTLAYDQEYLSQRVMQQLQAGYFFNKDLSLQAQAAYKDYSRQVFSTTVSQKTGDVRLNTAEGMQSVVDFKGFTARGSLVYRLSSIVSFQPGFDINLESGSGERLKSGKNRVDDYAFFLTSEITPFSWMSLRPGIRVIRNSVYDAPPVIPSLNTKFSLSKNLDLRLSYALGFRSPSLRELYFNFFDANHQIVGNPDLKAETSHSFNGSLTWKKMTPGEVAYSTVLGGFYNEVKNLIDYAVSANDPNTFILTNVSNSRTAGVSLTSLAKYRRWNLSAGGSYTGFYNDYSESDKSLPELQWSVEANANLGYSFPRVGVDLNFFYKYTGKRPSYVQSGPDIILTELKGYHWADFTVNKKICHYFTASAGVRNLFNVDRVQSQLASGGIHSAGNVRNIGYGRSYFAGISFNWQKN